MGKKILIIVLTVLLILSWSSVSAAPKSPSVVISNYTSEPKDISPGSNFKITMSLKNYGEYHARKIKITLKNEEGQENLGSFSPVNQSNVKYVSIINAGKSKDVEYNLYVSPQIEPGNYNLTVNLSYKDSNGITYEENQIIGLLVSEKNSVKILADDVFGDVNQGEFIESDIQIVNNGVSEIKGVNAYIEGEGLESQREYYGNFNSGDYDIYSYNTSFEEPGEKKIKIIVKYLNSINKETTVEKEITFNVLANEDGQNMTEENKGENWFTKLIKGIFGL
ncbi:MAG: COG1361 S-layer family protein [Eubacteriaceae bacterium]